MSTSLADRRKRLGLSQWELADRMGLSERTVRRMETADGSGRPGTRHTAQAQRVLDLVDRERLRRPTPRAPRTVGQLQRQLGVSQVALAHLLGVTPKTLQRWDSVRLALNDGAGAGSRSTHASLILQRLAERLAAGERDQLVDIIQLAQQDLAGAMGLLLEERKRRVS